MTNENVNDWFSKTGISGEYGIETLGEDVTMHLEISWHL